MNIPDEINSVLVEVAVKVQPIAKKQVDPDGSYYVTLQQLHAVIKEIQESYDRRTNIQPATTT